MKERSAALVTLMVLAVQNRKYNIGITKRMTQEYKSTL